MNLISQQDLLSRQNWNARRIKLFLGKPDQSIPNPQSPAFRRMKMYDMERVRKAETSPEFRVDVLRYLSKKERVEANAGN